MHGPISIIIVPPSHLVMFYLWPHEITSECLAIKNVLRMQGGHKPFCNVAISFSPKHYLMYSRFCLVWTLLLCIWETDGFAWLYVCVSLNLVTCVFYLILGLWQAVTVICNIYTVIMWVMLW